VDLREHFLRLMHDMCRYRRLLAAGIVSFLVLLGCDTTSGSVDQREYEWLEWRKELDSDVKSSETSYLSAQDAAYLLRGSTVYLRRKPAGQLRWLTSSPPPEDELLRVAYDGERAVLTRDPDVRLNLLEHGPWKLADGLMLSARRQKDESLRVTLYDRAHPDLENFHGFRFFDYNPEAVVEARFQKASEPSRQRFTTTQDRQSYVHVLGTLSFQYGGVPVVLDAYTFDLEDQPSYLAVMFRDLTNGKQTYGGGRYLEVELPDGLPVGPLEIDFNRATNFYCARSPHWNCPVLWEPSLRLAIEAGEMVPKDSSH